MRTAALSRFGPPEVLAPHEIPVPTPGPGQVLVRAEAIGVNFRDTWIRAGSVPAPPGTSLPLVPGNEMGGTVTEVGDGVPPALAGRRVVTSTGGSGGYAEYALATAEDLIGVPHGVDIAEATALLVQGRVALGSFDLAEVGSGERVLILGAAGGVGTLLTQLAVRAGAATVIGANRTDAHAELTEALGTTQTLAYGRSTFGEQLSAIAPGGVDIVFDGLGGAVAQIAFDNLAAGSGRHVVYGYAAGTPLAVDASTLVPRGVSVLGFGGQAGLPGTRVALAQRALDLLAAGSLRPVIGQRFPLANARDAHQAIEGRTTSGKTLLVPPAPPRFATGT